LSRTEALAFKLVDRIPAREAMMEGILYYSENSRVGIHLCACGCGTELVTPNTDGRQIAVEVKTGLATILSPIKNRESPCRSYYWIREGRVLWV
jgi:hypothetical protein